MLLWTAAMLGCLPSDAPHRDLISDLRLGRSKPAQRPDVLPSEVAGCTKGMRQPGTSAGGAGGMAFTTVTVTSGRVAPAAWTAFLMAASAAALSKCGRGRRPGCGDRCCVRGPAILRRRADRVARGSRRNALEPDRRFAQAATKRRRCAPPRHRALGIDTVIAGPGRSREVEANDAVSWQLSQGQASSR